LTTFITIYSAGRTFFLTTEGNCAIFTVIDLYLHVQDN